MRVNGPSVAQSSQSALSKTPRVDLSMVDCTKITIVHDSKLCYIKDLPMLVGLSVGQLAFSPFHFNTMS